MIQWMDNDMDVLISSCATLIPSTSYSDPFSNDNRDNNGTMVHSHSKALKENEHGLRQIFALLVLFTWDSHMKILSKIEQN